jgi:hypothetical protein
MEKLKYEKQPDYKEIVDIIIKYNITGKDRSTILSAIDDIYICDKIEGTILVQTNTDTFKTIQNATAEINKLHKELLELQNVKNSKPYKLTLKLKLWKQSLLKSKTVLQKSALKTK